MAADPTPYDAMPAVAPTAAVMKKLLGRVLPVSLTGDEDFELLAKAVISELHKLGFIVVGQKAETVARAKAFEEAAKSRKKLMDFVVALAERGECEGCDGDGDGCWPHAAVRLTREIGDEERAHAKEAPSS